MIITSPANIHIKQIRKLRDRKERQQTGLFYIEGLRVVAEAARQGARIETLITAPDLLTSTFGRELANSLAQAGTAVLEVSPDVFASISIKDGPVGIAAVLRQQWQALDAASVQPGMPWVALDSVADPGNLGTIIRTLDAVGGGGVILLDHSTDPYDLTAIRASMGAIFTRPITRATLAEFAVWKNAQQCAVVGTSDKASTDYHACRYPSRMVILMGSERQGLQPEHLALCDEVVAIPMLGSLDSLNLAVATGVILYEMYNQRRDAEGFAGKREAER